LRGRIGLARHHDPGRRRLRRRAHAPDAAIDDAAGGSYENIDYSDTPWADWEPASGCPTGLPGSSMVFIPLDDGGGFCIDSTEVTRGQYA
jgi:hypothetical protein